MKIYIALALCLLVTGCSSTGKNYSRDEYFSGMEKTQADRGPASQATAANVVQAVKDNDEQLTQKDTKDLESWKQALALNDQWFDLKMQRPPRLDTDDEIEGWHLAVDAKTYQRNVILGHINQLEAAIANRPFDWREFKKILLVDEEKIWSRDPNFLRKLHPAESEYIETYEKKFDMKSLDRILAEGRESIKRAMGDLRQENNK